MSDDERFAYKNGQIARLRGEPILSNPWDNDESTGDLYAAWNKGYMDEENALRSGEG